MEIENQEDISEEASHRLNDLCKMLHELEELFKDGEEVCVDSMTSIETARTNVSVLLDSLLWLSTSLSGSNSSSCLSCLRLRW